MEPRRELRRTRIDVEIRQVKYFGAFPTRFLWRRQWIRFWLGKPAGEIQGGGRWTRTGLRDKVLANQLKRRKYRRHQSTSNAGFQRHCTHLAIIPQNVHISHYLRKYRTKRRSAECVVATAGELKLLA